VDNVHFESKISALSRLLKLLMNANPLPFNSLVLSSLPSEPGVYRIFESVAGSGATVYVGQTENLRKRVYGSHLMGNTSVSPLKAKLLRSGRYPDAVTVKRYIRNDLSVQYLIVPNDLERKSFEHFAVAVLGPYFND
jgi:hypothetical protein